MAMVLGMLARLVEFVWIRVSFSLDVRLESLTCENAARCY
jgi:hypothetical protein